MLWDLSCRCCCAFICFLILRHPKLVSLIWVAVHEGYDVRLALSSGRVFSGASQGEPPAASQWWASIADERWEVDLVHSIGFIVANLWERSLPQCDARCCWAGCFRKYTSLHSVSLWLIGFQDASVSPCLHRLPQAIWRTAVGSQHGRSFVI